MILFTKWSSSPHAKEDRDDQDLTKELREQQIKDELNKHFEATKKIDIKVYFVAIFDIGKASY